MGAAIVASRYVLDQTGPGSLALMRYVIGFLFLLIPVMMMKRVPFERRDILPIALLGIFQFGVLIALLNYALLTISSARAALIFATFPLITMLLAAALGREKMTVPKTAGVLLTVLGVGFVMGEDIFVITDPNKGWIGEAAAFASAVTGAVCSVFYGPYLRKYPTVQVSAFAMVASIFFLALLAMSEGFFDVVPDFTFGGWVAIVFVGWASAVGYFLWLFGLRHVPPTQVTVFLSLNPITAVILGAWILSEPVTSGVIAGVVCVGLGLWCAQYRSKGGAMLDLAATGENTMSPLEIDHLAVAATTLEEGAAYVRDILGVDVPMGGEHTQMGTHNLVMSLGDDVYLEIITIAPHMIVPDRPRWFALDDPAQQSLLRERPRLIAWVARSTAIEADSAASTANLGTIADMARGDLAWRLSIPDDGSLNGGGALPQLIQWPDGPHPSSRMADLGCRFKALRIFHDDPAVVRMHLGEIGAQELVTVLPSMDKRCALEAVIETPNGTVLLK